MNLRPPLTKTPLDGQGLMLGPEWARYLTHEIPKALENRGYAVADLPEAGDSAYMRTVVTDASAPTFAAVVIGGGTDVVPVYSDGLVWRVG